MINHSEKAKALFLTGFNCSQAVLGAYCDELGLDFSTALKLSQPFGGGMGKSRGTCGAVTGMLMVLGLKYGLNEVDAEQREIHYGLARKAMKQFEEKAESLNCGELLGLAKYENAPTNHKENCKRFVELACDIIDEIGGANDKSNIF